ncbi:hypothetical protein K5X82_17160 [Halosquirtibacter xylanolyticus]|uniref:hypothetical protein n=1 Tax=Halosquirtibacter xylanolyticus TaxID=3374599 RepID=UPI0037490148|nr:hypothetical protein K5X82_17160 [Prolixibacteraceae bacterium]
MEQPIGLTAADKKTNANPKKHSLVMADFTYPKTLLANDENILRMEQTIYQNEKKRAENIFDQTYSDKDGSRYLEQNRENILKGIHSKMLSCIHPVYLFAKQYQMQLSSIFHTRLIFNAKKEKKYLKRFHFYSELLKLCSGNRTFEPVIWEHSLFKKLKIISKPTKLQIQEHNIDILKFPDPTIIIRYVLMVSPTLENSNHITKRVNHLIESVEFLSFPWCLQIERVINLLYEIYAELKGYHYQNKAIYAKNITIEQLHHSTFHAQLLVNITKDKPYNRLDEQFLNNFISLFEMYETEFHHFNHQKEKVNQETETNEKETKKRRDKQIIQPLEVPFQTSFIPTEDSLLTLHDELKRNKMTESDYGLIRSLFTKTSLSEKIIWTGKQNELNNFIVTLLDLEIIRLNKSHYWELISHIIQGVKSSYDPFNLSRCKQSKKIDTIQYICRKFKRENRNSPQRK